MTLFPPRYSILQENDRMTSTHFLTAQKSGKLFDPSGCQSRRPGSTWSGFSMPFKYCAMSL